MSASLSDHFSDPAWAGATVCFRLDAEASPGLLPRLLQPFARRDLVPDGIRSSRHGDSMRVEISIDAVAVDVVNMIEGNLRQVIGVHRVTRLSAHAAR